MSNYSIGMFQKYLKFCKAIRIVVVHETARKNNISELEHIAYALRVAIIWRKIWFPIEFRAFYFYRKSILQMDTEERCNSHKITDNSFYRQSLKGISNWKAQTYPLKWFLTRNFQAFNGK